MTRFTGTELDVLIVAIGATVIILQIATFLILVFSIKQQRKVNRALRAEDARLQQRKA